MAGMSIFSYLHAVIWATLAIGMLWYAVEKHVIVHVYRWAYDIGHAVPMPADAERGLVLGRPTYQQRWIVSIASIVQSAYMIWSGHANVFAEVVAMVLEVVVFLCGFWAAEKIHQRYSLTRVLEKFDQMGDARSSIGKESIRRKASSFSGIIAGKVVSIFQSVRKKAKQEVTPAMPEAPKAAPVKTVPSEPEVDRSDELFKEWTGKRR